MIQHNKISREIYPKCQLSKKIWKIQMKIVLWLLSYPILPIKGFRNDNYICIYNLLIILNILNLYLSITWTWMRTWRRTLTLTLSLSLFWFFLFTTRGRAWRSMLSLFFFLLWMAPNVTCSHTWSQNKSVYSNDNFEHYNYIQFTYKCPYFPH